MSDKIVLDDKEIFDHRDESIRDYDDKMRKLDEMILSERLEE